VLPHFDVLPTQPFLFPSRGRSYNAGNAIRVSLDAPVTRAPCYLPRGALSPSILHSPRLVCLLALVLAPLTASSADVPLGHDRGPAQWLQLSGAQKYCTNGWMWGYTPCCMHRALYLLVDNRKQKAQKSQKSHKEKKLSTASLCKRKLFARV
jgi:hypothetical protein